ncbi:MAG TPA: Stk1 family PASTA domain-containing Ser/Thr kinase [Armatimonadota bacterium]|jgi:serine/threonine-protein kinase
MMEGTVLAGRYRLESEIGEGGLAIVYKARDTVLERPVAVKLLRAEFASAPQVVARFRREAHAAAKLNHPNIIQIYDTGQDEDRGLYYLVMEYLGEPNLKRIINEYAPLPGRKVIEVATQCCRALAYAHKIGLVHRDVKPHNILFTDEGVAKLSDFGIAAAAGETGTIAPGLVEGSAAYISPEQAQGKPVGPQSDLYSLGCVMFECYTGRPPFLGNNAAQVAAMHVHERVPSPRLLNPAITTQEEFVLQKALARETSRRYRSAEEMLVDLNKLASGEELDRTGVMARAEERTMPLRVTPAAEVTPPPAAVTLRPTPITARPSAERRDGSLVWGTILAVVVAIIALVATAWLVKVAFYPGSSAKMIATPSLVGHSEGNARAELTEAGLKLGSVTYRDDPNSPKGTILSQTPTEGTTVAAGTPVSIIVNQGSEVAPVPDLVGASLGDAQRMLQQAGLILGKPTLAFSETIPEGQVIDQSIKPGTRVEKGTQVAVTVSKGPQQPGGTGEPGVTGTTGPTPPKISCTVDSTYQGSNPREHRYQITVTATGDLKDQPIKVVKRDESGGLKTVWDDRLQPGMSKRLSVVAQGNVDFQIYHEGTLAQEFHFPGTEETTSGTP